MILFRTIIAAASILSATYDKSVFSYRGINLRKRLNQECASSTTHLRALNVGSLSISFFSSPLGRMWGIKPFSTTTPSFPTYPASRQRFWSVLLSSFGTKTRSFNNGSRDMLSCRLAPLTTSDKGTPRSSTSKLRFVPFFSPIRGVGTNGFSSKRRFNIRSVRSFPEPGDSFHFVILGQSSQPQIAEDTCRSPLLKLAVNSCRSQPLKFLPWQGIPDNTGAQYVNNCGKIDPMRIFGFSASAWLAPVAFLIDSGRFRDQWLDQSPKFVGDLPCFNACHSATSCQDLLLTGYLRHMVKGKCFIYR
jgi:hypothetical protein